MMRRNRNKLFVFNDTFSIIKFIFQVLCFIILIYQLIDITNTYLNFPYEVKLSVIDYNSVSLPSITFCLRKDHFWHKRNFKSIYNEVNKTMEIIDNKTYLSQIFDLTINSSSIISCFLNIKNKESFDNCERVGRVAEFLSKSEKFEKCFTLFNINKMNKSLINYGMNKSSRIEFYFLPELLRNKNIVLKDNKIIELMYLSVYSSQSIFKTGDFQPINISFDSNDRVVYKFEFSKIIVRSLRWPHEMNCKSNEIKATISKLIYSFEDCVNSCILNRIIKSDKCIQIKVNFKIDLILENENKNLKLCAENITQEINTQKLEIYCLRKCHQNCIDEYIQVYSYDTIESTNKSIEIKSSNSPLLVYELIPKFSLFNYASNLGGIISMWFGLAIIDLYKLIEKFINFFDKISTKLNSIIYSIDMYQNLLIYRIVSFILSIDIHISLVFIKVRKIKWKLLFNIFCLTCFV